jgi:hypothetical protein
MVLMTCVFPISTSPITYCNICSMEVICVNISNAQTYNLFFFNFFLTLVLMDVDE